MDLSQWQFWLSVASLFIPLVGAAWARDQALQRMITGTRSDWQREISAVKDDARHIMGATAQELHDRVNRTREEYVRRDDLHAHLGRIDKRLDDMSGQMERRLDVIDRKLDQIRGTQ